MPRSTRTDGEQTRERILEVALPLFSDHGYAGTSVRTIAKAASVNVATLAYHFSGKEGLYDTVVQRIHEDLASQFPTEGTQGAPRDILQWWIREAWNFVRSHQPHLRMLVRHVLDHGRQPDVNMERWSEPALERAEEMLCLFRPEWTSARRRMLVLTLMHVTVRFNLEDPVQLATQIGIDPDRLDEEVVDWLTQLSLQQLGLAS